jgi:hypothetical protein
VYLIRSKAFGGKGNHCCPNCNGKREDKSGDTPYRVAHRIIKYDPLVDDEKVMQKLCKKFKISYSESEHIVSIERIFASYVEFGHYKFNEKNCRE